MPFTALIVVVVVSAALARVPSSPTAVTLDMVAPDVTSSVPEKTPRTLSPDDVRRTADLATLGVLLETYRSDHGTYPTTESYTMTLCASGWDPGCLLTSLSSQLPASDGLHPYWYRSDGTSYTLFALVDASPDQDDCPPELPPTLAGGSVLCVSSPGGVR